MEDRSIINLFLQRDETAIKESEKKYGSYCYKIASNILTIHEDAEECVNDTWVSVWNRIPPTIPVSLRAFLGKIVRDVALSRYRFNHAKKRYAGIETMLDELQECIPSEYDIDTIIDNNGLSELINEWIGSLAAVDRVLFIKRYYYGESIKDLAKLKKCTDNQMSQRMMSLRRRLKSFLISKGVTL